MDEAPRTAGPLNRCPSCDGQLLPGYPHLCGGAQMMLMHCTMCSRQYVGTVEQAKRWVRLHQAGHAS